MRAHVDLMEFREALVTLANAQDERGFAVEAVSQRDHVVQDIRRAEETLKSFPYLDSNVAITLEAVGRSLPLQADALVQLASAGDWQGVRLRLANQVRTLVGLTSQLVQDVDQEVTHEHAQALASTRAGSRPTRVGAFRDGGLHLTHGHRVWLVRNPQYHRATCRPGQGRKGSREW